MDEISTDCPDVNSLSKELWSTLDHITFKSLLSLRAYPDYRMNKSRNTLLHTTQDPVLVSTLLEAKSDPNSMNSCLCTPLHTCKNKDIAVLLLNAKANLNLVNSDGFTALHPEQNLDVVEVLLQHDADPNNKLRDNSTLLHYRFDKHSTAWVKLLLSYKANPNAICRYRTPLHINIDDEESVLSLLRAQADPNAASHDGARPLHLVFKNTNIIDILLEYKADPNAMDIYNCTALFNAQTDDIVTHLLLGKADPNLPNFKGQTPLHLSGDYKTTIALLNNKADVNYVSSLHRTPLHMAKSSIKIKALIDARADISLQDDDGSTALFSQHDQDSIHAILEEDKVRYHRLYTENQLHNTQEYNTICDTINPSDYSILHLYDQYNKSVLFYTNYDCIYVYLQHGCDPCQYDINRQQYIHRYITRYSNTITPLQLSTMFNGLLYLNNPYRDNNRDKNATLLSKYIGLTVPSLGDSTNLDIKHDHDNIRVVLDSIYQFIQYGFSKRNGINMSSILHHRIKTLLLDSIEFQHRKQ